MSRSLVLILLIRLFQHFQLPVHKLSVKEQRQIVLMVILILLIGSRPIITDLESTSLMENTGRCTINCRLESHLCKIGDCSSYNSFKAKAESYIYRLFPA